MTTARYLTPTVVSAILSKAGVARDDIVKGDWDTAAACASADPEVWFPEQGGDPRVARAICEQCPVLALCGIRRELYDPRGVPGVPVIGVWAGMSRQQHRRQVDEKVLSGWAQQAASYLRRRRSALTA